MAWDQMLLEQMPKSVQRQLGVMVTASSAVSSVLVLFIRGASGCGIPLACITNMIKDQRQERKHQQVYGSCIIMHWISRWSPRELMRNCSDTLFLVFKHH